MNDQDIQASKQQMMGAFLSDALERLKCQHDFSQGAFKTLVLVNGGAIIAMLTYAGNVVKTASIGGLKPAFIGYATGLVLTIIANILAYLSQGAASDHSLHYAKVYGGLIGEDTSAPGIFASQLLRYLAIGCVLGSLTGFIVGSFMALKVLVN